MKKLSIEEKARAYDRVSKEVKDFFEGRQKMYSDVSQTLEYLFPELRESEDERIRKELLAVINDLVLPDEQKYRFVAWLEKQGQTFTKKDVDDAYLKGICDAKHELEKQCEQKSYASETMNEKGDFDNGFTRMMEKEQKPAWNKEDEKMLSDIVDCIKNLPVFYESVNINGEDKITERFICDAINWLKSLKDRVQPKQEWSEEDIVAIDCAVEVVSKDLPSLAASIERLKSLRPQNKWKPSDEQMKALDSAIHCYAGISPTNNKEVFALEIMKEQLQKLRGE